MKDLLTQHDLEILEERLISNFNLRLEEFAKSVIESPPKTGIGVSTVIHQLRDVMNHARRVTASLDGIKDIKVE